MHIKNKKAIVTGASSGLGGAIAKALILKGATVYGIARNSIALNAIRETVGDAFIPVPLDISDETNVSNWISETFSSNHLPDILINNAGVGSFGKIDETPTNEWLNMININLNGLYFITSKVVPFLKKNENTTHIVNIGSILGSMGREEGSAYCATKYGVTGFSDALFKELRFFNIKVTCLNPGSIETDFFKTSGIDKHSNMLHPSDIADTLVHVLETPDNMLINELTIRPLHPKKK